MPDGKFFVDSNVVLYTLGNDLPKKFIAATLLAARPIISTQVLAETAYVARRKLGFSVGQVQSALSSFRGDVEICVITEAIFDDSLSIALQYGYSTYDSLILAAALASSCVTLYSEDMQHSQIIRGKLTIINPFKILPA
ncbi:MAG: PIN domain-containing protein [Gallionellaceae bacterium]|nr:PIN domain-containing protein [Gallionellaceae bacterium]